MPTLKPTNAIAGMTASTIFPITGSEPKKTCTPQSATAGPTSRRRSFWGESFKLKMITDGMGGNLLCYGTR